MGWYLVKSKESCLFSSIKSEKKMTRLPDCWNKPIKSIYWNLLKEMSYTLLVFFGDICIQLQAKSSWCSMHDIIVHDSVSVPAYIFGMQAALQCRVIISDHLKGLVTILRMSRSRGSLNDKVLGIPKWEGLGLRYINIKLLNYLIR